ncbi:MAG: hypothetical protein M3174_02330 [Actinomycetota bacterium]|nr:hypothetical protein [Actinomycetota bacterium]
MNLPRRTTKALARTLLVPAMILVCLPPARAVVDTVATPEEGSSDPTWFASNRRVATTKTGRVLVVHGAHAEGVQLKWRDPGEPWRKRTTGKVSDGLLLRDSGTGDWTASIATATGGDGRERAWVVWSGSSGAGNHRLQMRRLTGLGAAEGPRVGPTVTYEEPTHYSEVGGASKVDLAFEKKPAGGYRGVLTWLEEVDADTYEITTAWFTALGKARPSLHHQRVLSTEIGTGRIATLAPTPTGMAVVAVAGDGTELHMWRHEADTPLGTWIEATVGADVSSYGSPSAIALDNVNVLAEIESNTSTHTVTVQRWDADGNATVDLVPSGQYEQPTITTDGESAWIVMVRTSDQRVVSRERTGMTWGLDIVEIGGAAGGDPDWPNAPRRISGKLQFIVKGPEHGALQSAVLFRQRRV